MKNSVILLAIVMVAGFVGCEREVREEPRDYDPETEAPPSALVVRTYSRAAEDQKVVSDEAKDRADAPARERPGSEPGGGDEAATKPAATTKPATGPAGEGEAATRPAGEDEAATKPAGEGGGEPAP